MNTEAPRRVVRARLDPALVDEATRSLAARSPSDRVRETEDGWAIADEVPWFMLFFAVALCALALLAHVGTVRAPGYPRGLHTLPWALDLAWIASAWRFGRALYGEWSVSRVGASVRFRRAWRGRVLSESVVDPEDVCSLRVRAERTVIVEGPRQSTLAQAFDAGWLDPPALPQWVADAIATVVERALARAPSQ
jgi:hypothetical protein